MPYISRQEKLARALNEAGLAALALNPGPSLTYMTGLHFHLSERPIVALFIPGEAVTLVLPELEAGKASALAFPIQTFPYGENPAGWPTVFQQAAQSAGMDGMAVGVEPGRLRVLELRLLEAAGPKARFISAEDSVASLRMRKDEGELSAMRSAVIIAQDAMQATRSFIKPGVTERQIASELTSQLLSAGSEPAFPFSPIVSGGPNGANPHATPTERPLQIGDLLVIDWGATQDGYVSDLTRTFAIGNVEDEFSHIAQIVHQANTAGRAAAGPGVPVGDVDRAARKVIDEAGYGEYFFHRTGHGLGMEGHEPPYIRGDSDFLLDVGMTFTVEPGIYLTGRGGVRIEDDVVITKDGAESLSDLPRELWQI